jgi:hypothetical protein
MTKQEEQDFKRLIKEGTIEVLVSTEGKKAIKEASLEALRSDEGQDAIAKALETPKAKEALAESFADNFREVVIPALEDMSNDIKVLKESTLQRDEFSKALKQKILGSQA